MNPVRFIAITAIILAAAFCRLVPHPPNVTPMMAMALFGGAYLANRKLAFLVPFAAMLASDFFLGFHGAMPFVYLAFGLVVWLGFGLRVKRGMSRTFGAALTGSVLFFVLSNFGVWLTSGMYPLSFAGILECYVAAIPFFRQSLAGDLLYTLVFFGGFALIQSRVPVLRPAVQSGS